MIATGIITAPRPRSTIVESLASYRRAGFDNDVMIFAEPGPNGIVADRVTMLHNEVKLGNLRNWTRAVSMLSSLSPDYIMICEDDISWCAGARVVLEEALKSLPRMAAGGMSLYLPNRHARQMTLQHGWNAGGAGRKTWGFQCTLFTLRQARNLLANREFGEILRDPSRDKNIDAIVGQVLQNQNLPILYLNPCLVDHDLGRGNSSLGYRDDRPDLETSYFRGPRA